MAIFLKSYNYESVQTLENGKKAAICQLVDASAPGTFPVNGDGIDGKFPTVDPADTTFLPGSLFHATSTASVYVLNPNGTWDEQ